MTRSGRAFALPTPEPRTAATASSSSRSGPDRPEGSRLLPTPAAGNYGDGAGLPTPWQARRDRQEKPGRNGNGTGTPLPVATALLTAPLASDNAPGGAGQADGEAGPATGARAAGILTPWPSPWPARRRHEPAMARPCGRATSRRSAAGSTS